jgi:hypothetical protein
MRNIELRVEQRSFAGVVNLACCRLHQLLPKVDPIHNAKTFGATPSHANLQQSLSAKQRTQT